MSRSAAPSPNLATLESKIFGDQCEGKFFIDITDSVFIGDGAQNGLGVKVQITSPTGVIIKAYTDAYDIAAPFDSIFEYSIPTQGGNYQYGSYKISVEYVDAHSSVYELEKTLRLSEPDKNNKTKKWGTLAVSMKANCRDGKLAVSVANLPVYCGKTAQDRTNTFTFKYPSGTLDNEDVVQTNFSAQLFEGSYLLEGTVCATYAMGDNIFINILYKVKARKDVKCELDETCVAAQLENLYLQAKAACGAEQDSLKETISETFRLVNLARFLADSNSDPSDTIADLEKLLGCTCTCNCNDSTPIINNDPSENVTISGCNVNSTTSGLTTDYEINNYDHQVRIPIDTAGVLTISEPALDEDNCIKYQDVTFSLSTLYAQIKNIANSTDEQAFWASIIKESLAFLDLSCVGADVADLTFLEIMQLIVNKACAATVTCDAEITDHSETNSGADVIVTFTANSDTKTVDIYLDNILQGTIYYAGETDFTLAGAADGSAHTYRLIPKCSNGVIGTEVLSDEFTFIGCPDIAAASLTSTSVSDADCPYDLTSLENAAPVGITYEWHTANNTNAGSLVADTSSANSGVYYVFAKNGDGCYSIGVAVTIICVSEECSAPQGMLVTTIVGGNKVAFQSAVSPPEGNSYTVKRRLESAPDIDGSYTTIGDPAWNSGTNRWEILDDSAADNILYTYKAISNCESTTPSISYNYANLVCPELTLTPGTDTIDYSFTDSGGDVDQYQVKFYNAAGTVLISTDTILPAFSTPITGTFIYADSDTTYKVRVRMFIGSYYKDCDFETTSTNAEVGDVLVENNIGGCTITSVGGILGFTPSPALPVADGDSTSGTHEAFTGIIGIGVSGTPDVPSKLGLYRNDILLECLDVTAAGGYIFASQTYAAGDEIRVTGTVGTCS